MPATGFEMQKIKFSFAVKNGATPKSDEPDYWDGDIMWVTPADFTTSQCYIAESRRRISDAGLNSCGTNLVPAGSIIVSNRAPIGLIGIASNNLCTSQGCKSLVKKRNDVNEKYVYYYLATQEKALNALGRGTTFFELSSFDLANFKIPAPSVDIQSAIVAYLDRRTAEIDVLISDLQRQAEMLDRYKRAIIAEAVTKGLDKAAPRKDSGIDWIGEVPEGWIIIPLRAAAKMNSVKNTGNACENLLSLSYGKIIQKDINTNFGLLPESFEGYQIVQPGYTVLRLTDLQNDKRSLRTGYVTETGIITSAYLGLIPLEQFDSKYFTYLLHTYDLKKIYYGLGGGLRQSLKYSDMKTLPVLVPPMPVQKAIVDYIDEKTSQVEGLIIDISFLIDRVRTEGSGHNYLIQHSAGSGKSNSIAWLAHHLSNLHDANNEVVFHSIIVITDRRVLDKQLQRDIYNMEHKQGVVVRVDKNAKQLTTALEKGDKIIICTLQKFPFVDVQKVTTTGKRFAIIIDEAHSSQTGKASERLKEVLVDISAQGEDAIEKKLHEYAVEEAKLEAEELDSDEQLAEDIKAGMAAHGHQSNLSFFAFTATPKQKTLEIFGTKNAAGKPEPCHVYSMRQAIEEHFIFNVLENYTTYETYFKIGKKIADDPVYGKGQANKALGKYMSLHPHNLAQKTEVIVEHFRSQVQHKIGGRAKAMLVTGSRLHAVRYYFEFQKYITKMGYTDLGVLVAFSGTVKDNITGQIKEYTEENINNIPESELPERFESGEYQLLLVAEKYQTGFDQPLLHTMYVDKKLSGVKAVQTLSRINRMCEGKTETFVLDFVNSRADIESAFQDYYQETGVSETTDPNVIYDIKNVLDSFMLYNDAEIDSFAKVFFKETKSQANIDLAKLNSYIDPAIDRYKALTEVQDKMDFRSALAKFLRLYSFLTHIINLGDEKLYKFYAYGKCLFRKLPKEGERVPDLNNDVVLQYYRLQKIHEGSIEMAKEDGVLYNATSGMGLPLEDEKENLSLIIARLNERLGTNFTEMDKVLEQFVQDMSTNAELVLRSKNPLDLFKIVYDNNIMDIVLNRMAQNQEFCEKYLEDEEFRVEIDKILLPLVHARLSKI